MNRSETCAECALGRKCVTTGDRAGKRGLPLRLPRILRRGRHLFRDGDRCDALHLVRSGAFKTYVATDASGEQVIGFQVPGEVLGVDAIDGGRYQCNAVTLNTASVCELPLDALSGLCACSTAALRRLLGHLSRQTRRDERMLLTLGQRSAEQRVASFLIEHSRRQGRHGVSPYDLDLPMSRTDIASYLALAGATVSRVIARLQAQRIVLAERRRIHILDIDALAGIAGDRAGERERYRGRYAP